MKSTLKVFCLFLSFLYCTQAAHVSHFNYTKVFNTTEEFKQGLKEIEQNIQNIFAEHLNSILKEIENHRTTRFVDITPIVESLNELANVTAKKAKTTAKSGLFSLLSKFQESLIQNQNTSKRFIDSTPLKHSLTELVDALAGTLQTHVNETIKNTISEFKSSYGSKRFIDATPIKESLKELAGALATVIQSNVNETLKNTVSDVKANFLGKRDAEAQSSSGLGSLFYRTFEQITNLANRATSVVIRDESKEKIRNELTSIKNEMLGIVGKLRNIVNLVNSDISDTAKQQQENLNIMKDKFQGKINDVYEVLKQRRELIETEFNSSTGANISLIIKIETQKFDVIRTLFSNLLEKIQFFADKATSAVVHEESKEKIKEDLFEIKEEIKEIIARLGNICSLIKSDLTKPSNQDAQKVAKRAVSDQLSDMLESLFGLDEVKGSIITVKQNLYDQFNMILQRTAISGVDKIQKAMPILKNLIIELKIHANNATPLITNAIQNLTISLSERTRLQGKRDVNNYALNTLGMAIINSQLNNTKSVVKAQLWDLVGKLMVARDQAVVQSKVILAQLVKDLKAHANDAVPIIAQAIVQLTQVINEAEPKPIADIPSQQEKRDVEDVLSKNLNFNEINVQLKKAGVILSKQLKELTLNLILTKNNGIEQAKIILKQMIEDLKAHANDAVPIVAQAILDLSNAIKESNQKTITENKEHISNEKRDIKDYAVKSLGLATLNKQLNNTKSAVKGQLWNIVAQLMVARKQTVEKSKVILAQLSEDLKTHANDAVPIVANAVGQLTKIINDSALIAIEKNQDIEENQDTVENQDIEEITKEIEVKE